MSNIYIDFVSADMITFLMLFHCYLQYVEWPQEDMLTEVVRGCWREVLHIRTITFQKCEAVLRRARNQCSSIFVSLNSRLENDEEEEVSIRCHAISLQKITFSYAPVRKTKVSSPQVLTAEEIKARFSKLSP